MHTIARPITLQLTSDLVRSYKMKISTIINPSDNQEYVLIDDENGNFISMLKTVFDTLPSNSADPVEAEKPKK
jgi:hypothetical protein